VKIISFIFIIRACEALRKCLPEILHDPDGKLITDEIVRKWHLNLLENLKIIPPR
jgi:CCR4-NOT transcription complex subunit 9